MPSIELSRSVRWSDADPAGRLYFPRIFDYYGEAEIALLKSLGYDRGEAAEERYDFPRVAVQCQFHKILSVFDPFIMKLSVGKIGRTSIRYDFEVLTAQARESAITGTVTVVAIRQGKPVPVPEELRSALTEPAGGA